MFRFQQVRHLSQRVVLPQRSVLGISGPEAKKFVQGLCTNDLNLLKKEGDCLAASFLTSKGRVFANAFVYQLPSEGLQDILVEVDSRLAAALSRYLTVYKLRAKATIKALPYSVLLDLDSNDEQALQESRENSGIATAAFDPRVANYGIRIISKTKQEEVDANTASWLAARETLSGIAEGPELDGRIPLECNLDLLNYISFAKGCYVGQELTARTRFKGLVRKRLVPFLVSDGKSSSTKNANAFDVLSPEIVKNILDKVLAGNEPVAESSRAMRGYRVFENAGDTFSSYEDKSPVGEVIHTNKEGTMGLAIVSLEALSSHKGDFTLLNIPREAAEDDPAKKEETPKGDEIVRFIGTFKPTWFQGLDEKTNIKI